MAEGGSLSTIRHFKTFAAIARCGTFAAAADRVGLTQAAVSLQMRALEIELKHSLFDRSGRVSKLNGFGRAILPRVEQMIRQYEELQAASGTPGDSAGTVSVGSVVSVMGTLAAAVAQFKRTHPRLEVHLATGKSIELTAKVEAGELDAALTIETPARRNGSLRWTPLYSEPIVVLAGSAATTNRIRVLLSSQPFLRFDRTQRTGILIDRALRKECIQVNEFLELNSLETIVELVRQNVGVSVVPLLRNASWENDPALRVIRAPTISIDRSVGMIERRGHGRDDIMTLIKQHIRAPRHPIGRLTSPINR
jgi:DNA-binding transcriptional LysR family regulator